MGCASFYFLCLAPAEVLPDSDPREMPEGFLEGAGSEGPTEDQGGSVGRGETVERWVRGGSCLTLHLTPFLLGYETEQTVGWWQLLGTL